MTNRRNRIKNEGQHSKAFILAIGVALAILAAAATGIYFACSALHKVWQEQCRIEDRELDVVITVGKMIHPDVITMEFGLTNGANMAQIPLADMRLKLLEKVPNIKDIKIERRLPNRVTIDVIEREAIARIATPRGRSDTGRVADAEGVVFRFSNNTSMLPIIRESADPATVPGKKLSGAAAAALRLVEAASQPEFADLRILEIDTSHKDYLLLTLGNYDRVKLAWDHMDEDTRLSRESLNKQLKRVAKAININITPRSTLWIATDWGTPGRVYASDANRSGSR